MWDSDFTQNALVSNDADMAMYRYCLSDQTSLSINTILTPNWTPVRYAEYMVKHHHSDLMTFINKNIPKLYQTAYLFDRIVSCCVVHRVAAVRPYNTFGIFELSAKAFPFLLLLQNHPLSGLGQFTNIAETFIHFNTREFHTARTSPLTDLIPLIGDASQPSWIMANRFWKRYFGNHPSHFTIFRQFLHIVLVTHLFPDQQIVSAFDCDRSQIEDWTNDFITLRNQSSPDRKQVNVFFQEIGLYFDLLKVNGFFYMLVEGDFTTFHDLHQKNFGDAFERKPECVS